MPEVAFFIGGTDMKQRIRSPTVCGKTTEYRHGEAQKISHLIQRKGIQNRRGKSLENEQYSGSFFFWVLSEKGF